MKANKTLTGSSQLKDLLDIKDLKKQPLELKKICESIFYNGKGLRPQLVSLVGESIGLTKNSILFLSRLIEYIHNSSLLHDDFIDHTKKRHQNTAAWFKYSPSQAVLAGDYLLAKVNIYLAQEANLNLLQKTAQVICELAEGEFLQRQLLNFKSKKLKQRSSVSDLKTASLFKWCLQAPFIYQNRNSKKLHKALEKLSHHLGLLFQRSDDLIDFNIRNQHKKPYLVDLKEGYFNSFACFLLKGASAQQEKKLIKAQSLSDIHKAFPDFKAQLQAFDALNKGIIKKAEKTLQEIQSLIDKKEYKLIPALKEQLSFFYWRKNGA